MKRISFLVLFLHSICIAQPFNKWDVALQAFYKLTPPIKIHLFFNQPSYIPGDTVFFRASAIAAIDNLPVRGSHIFLIDVIDPVGNVMVHTAFRIKDGWSGGQFVIPADVSPGIYKLVAYNDWVKNFKEKPLFQTNFLVSGELLFQSKSDAQIGCFSEGGSLVAGVKNNMIVAYKNYSGPAYLIDENKNTIESLSLDRGYGTFSITPDSSKTYYIRINDMEKKLDVQQDGITIKLNRGLRGNLRTVLAVPKNSLLKKQELWLLITNHRGLAQAEKFSFVEKDSVGLDLALSTLSPGVHFLAIVNADGNELATRIFYNETDNNILVKVSLSQKEISTRSEVPIKISLCNDSNEPELARLSVSVYNADVFTHSPILSSQLDDYLMIGSDVEAHSLAYRSQPLTGRLLDNFLITQKWPWYAWTEILKGSKPVHFMNRFQTLKGNLIFSDQPINADSLLMTIYLMHSGDLYEVPIEPSGEFNAPLLMDFYNEEEIFYRVERNGKKLLNVQIKVQPEKIAFTPAFASFSQLVSDNYYHYATQRDRVMKAYRYFERAEKQLPQRRNPNSVLEERIFGADMEIDLDDYMLFPTLKETIHEIIPYLQYRKKRGKDVVRIYLPDKKAESDESPVFVIDGVITESVDYFLGLAPSDIDKIKLVYSHNKLSVMGAIGKNGIVLVETKILNNAQNVPRNTTSFTLMGLTPVEQFRIFSTHPVDTRSPQLKSCLYWNPELRLDQEGEVEFKFFTTDDVGRFVVHVEGLTTTGVPITWKEYFQVVYRVD